MANEGDAVRASQEHAGRLRVEIEGLVRQAHVLLHGDVQAKRPAAHRPPDPVRIEREKELEANLQRSEWFRREIKRMKQELEGRDTINPLVGGQQVVDRDPMELHNLIAEKRKELTRLQKAGRDLDKMAEVQKRAEEANTRVTPQMEARLKLLKREMEAQKRKNVKLQADRLKLSSARKATEEEVRVAGGRLRNKAALLGRQAKPLPAPYSEEEPKLVRQLRREIDILKSAAAQDERKFKISEKEEELELEYAAENSAAMRESIKKREGEVDRLKAALESLKLKPPQQEEMLPQQPFGPAAAPSVPEDADACGVESLAPARSDDGRPGSAGEPPASSRGSLAAATEEPEEVSAAPSPRE